MDSDYASLSVVDAVPKIRMERQFNGERIAVRVYGFEESCIQSMIWSTLVPLPVVALGTKRFVHLPSGPFSVQVGRDELLLL